MTTRSITVGTAESCDLRVNGDEYASSKHCRIFETPQGFTVQDLASANGTWIVHPGATGPLARIGTKVVGVQRIPRGYTIRVGRTTLPWVADA